MDDTKFKESSLELIELLNSRHLAPFDLILQDDIREKMVELMLNGIPEYADYESSILFRELCKKIENEKVDHLKVVVFGGGTGLSNIIGGDCRQESWIKRPFAGLKQVFPRTKAIVCVTDDGGSTGQLLKDIPLIAIGDIRHVMLSSIQKKNLTDRYGLNEDQSLKLASALYKVFNYRFEKEPESPQELLLQSGADLNSIPLIIQEYIVMALGTCFKKDQCNIILKRPNCLGNIIILAVLMNAVKKYHFDSEMFSLSAESEQVLRKGLSDCAQIIGAAEESVLPCTFTPAQLRFLYTNGVEVSGEKKSSKAQRGYPVDKVFVDFTGKPYITDSVLDQIIDADILIMAPGSLYSSILPVFQVPGIADAVRKNSKALKLLISNLWVQAGETDKSISDPDRKFHVSDMIRAYHRNLPGGISKLCDQVLCLSLKDVPATVIQNYAVEGKIPIYLDREVVKSQGFTPIECGFYSKTALLERQVIQHDPHIVAQTVKTLYLVKKISEKRNSKFDCTIIGEKEYDYKSRQISLPSQRYKKITEKIYSLPVEILSENDVGFDECKIRSTLVDIIWEHKDVELNHLENINGITCIADQNWRRDQRWDNVFSFYDPDDRKVKIRQDRFDDRRTLEIAFLITVGQALLGNYAYTKSVTKVFVGELSPGSIFNLHLLNKEERRSFFSDDEIQEYLQLARMVKQSDTHFTRLVNGEEGFTPPGLLMGVMYAWYLDNMFASHIEYKMSVLKVRQSDLIPEQLKMKDRRERLITFFRQTVFGKNAKML